MRIIEPGKVREQKRRKKRIKISIYSFVFLLFLLASGYGYVLWSNRQKPDARVAGVSTYSTDQTSSTASNQRSDKPVGNFTGDQFKKLYQSVAYPNTQKINEIVPITGNTAADAKIRGLAEARGYHTTSVPVQSIAKVAGFDDGDYILQPMAFISWQKLKEAAAKDKIPVTILSAYRSIEYQRDLFLSRLLTPGVTVELIAAGKADQAVENTLHITALPGYSRHHTGYTVDLWCQDGSGQFASSICFKWMNYNNYKNAKEYGWIPSYPAGTNEQGPEPEPWEYVWVGRDSLTQ